MYVSLGLKQMTYLLSHFHSGWDKRLQQSSATCVCLVPCPMRDPDMIVIICNNDRQRKIKSTRLKSGGMSVLSITVMMRLSTNIV